jgi:hypothetical protein
MLYSHDILQALWYDTIRQSIYFLHIQKQTPCKKEGKKKPENQKKTSPVLNQAM